MSLATKNVATVLVGSVLVLALSFAFVTPAKADLLSDLQAQVQALLAQIAALGGGSTTTGGSCTTFTMDFQQGSSGAEVIAIQKFLNSHGAQVAVTGAGSPGNETSYFGAMTKAAVAKFQAANGITPAAGYWGPITRAKANSMCASTPTTPTTPGGETLNGSAGSATVNSYSSDTDDEVYAGETEKVLGFRVEASGADVRVTNVRVKFSYTGNTTGSDRLANYASEVSIWANGQKIAAMSPSSFVRDSAGVYSANIPVSQVVRMGSNNKVTFNVGVTANSNLDSEDVTNGSWKAELLQTRYTDPTGAVLFESTVVTETGILFKRLSSSSDVKLRLGEGSGNPKAGNVEVDEDNTTDVTLAEFTLKAEGSAMEFDTLTATSTVSGVGGTATTSAIVDEFYLMRGSTRIADITAPTGNSVTQAFTFDLDDTEEIAKDATQTYRIVARVKEIGTGSGSDTAFDQGDTLEIDVLVTGIPAKSTADGKSVTNTAGSVTTHAQALYSEGVKVAKVGENVNVTTANTAGDSYGTFRSTLRITAFGSDDVYIPLNASSTSAFSSSSDGGVQYAVLDAGGSVASTASTTATVTRLSGGSIVTVNGFDLVKISGGSSADIELNVSYNPIIGVTGGQFRTQIWGVGFRGDSDAALATTRVQANPADEFRTGYSATINN